MNNATRVKCSRKSLDARLDFGYGTATHIRSRRRAGWRLGVSRAASGGWVSFSLAPTRDYKRPASGPAPEVAVRMICRREEPITTKMKKPSITGPTLKDLDLSLARMSTSPRLWMFLA